MNVRQFPLAAFLAPIAGALGLACATSTSNQWDAMRPQLASLKGRNLSAVVDHLGAPDRDITIAGRRLLVWEHASSGKELTVNTQSAFGQLGSTPGSGVSTGLGVRTTRAACELEVEVGADETVRTLTARGELPACKALISLLPSQEAI